MLAAGVGAGAIAAGAGARFWRARQDGMAAPEVWSLVLDTPDGGRLALSSLRGRPLALNFWATWCPPCVREMPTLDRFQRDFQARGWQVVGIAADQAQPVHEFLVRTPVAFPIGLAGFGGIELSRRLGNLSGGLPFTVIFGRDGQIVHRHMGETSYMQLAAWAEGIS
jgi:thiol-disulfide isomerase/thioredoxin